MVWKARRYILYIRGHSYRICTRDRSTCTPTMSAAAVSVTICHCHWQQGLLLTGIVWQSLEEPPGGRANWEWKSREAYRVSLAAFVRHFSFELFLCVTFLQDGFPERREPRAESLDKPIAAPHRPRLDLISKSCSGQRCNCDMLSNPKQDPTMLACRVKGEVRLTEGGFFYINKQVLIFIGGNVVIFIYFKGSGS